MTESLSRKWLFFASLLVILTGAISGLGSFQSTSLPWRLLLDVVEWPYDGTPETFTQYERALSGVLGGVLIGWGAAMACLLRSPNIAFSTTKQVIAISVITWFVVDSGISIFVLPGNVILNLVFLAAFWPVFLKTK
jgi:hypothetical protein